MKSGEIMALRLLGVALMLVVALAALAGFFAQADAASEGEVTVIVYVKEGAQQRQPGSALVPLAAAVNSESVVASIPDDERDGEHHFSSFDGFTARVSMFAYERLKANPNLEVFKGKIYHVMLDGSAPLVNATLVPGLVYNGSNVTGNTVGVCVLDTGINYTHPALGGCLTTDFTGGTCAKVLSGYDYVNSDNDPMDNQGHGSHVAGIIASTDSTYRGIAPNASLIAVKVCNDAALSTCADQHIISGIDWCINNASRFNISVISMSLGGGLYTSYCDDDSSFRRPIDDAVVKNISVVVAAGNSGSTSQISDPACVKNSTAVSSTTKSDGFSGYNRNNITDLLAPGSSINSVNYQGGFTGKSGTSMATPHVSGAIALVAQFHKLTKGWLNMSPNTAYLALNSSGVNLTDSGGSGIQFARISVYNAILQLDSGFPNLTYVSPTLTNNSNSSSLNVFVNITSSEVIQAAFLEWNNNTNIVNYSMVQNGSALAWARNHTSSSSGVITYRVWGNDSSGNIGVSEKRTVQVNNTAPVIGAFQPASSVPNIVEPNDIIFNVTYSDTQNDLVTLDWYVNGTIQLAARNGNFTFSGNYSQASQGGNGTYNITAVVSDGSLTSVQNWTLTVNNTNRAPSWAGFANQTAAEDSLINFTVTAADLDNDTITYFINNTFNFTINSTNGNVTFNLSNAGNFSGIFYLAINASDGLSNASELIFVNITPVNDTPALFPIANITINETDFANITAVGDDAEKDLLNFTINDTFRFNLNTSNQSAANFSWKTNLSDSGAFQFKVNVSDFGASSIGFFNVTVIDRFDFDGDGIPDVKDSDDDNDGIPDDADSVNGNRTMINSSTIQAASFNITVNSSANFSRLLSEALFVNVSNGSRSLAQFFWNFSLGNFSLNFTVDVQNQSSPFGGLVISGLRLQPNQTKNITISNLNSTVNSTCIKDGDVTSLTNISRSCNSANETLVTCPGTAAGYNCTLIEDSSLYLITNVSFTAAVEQCADADADGFYVSGCGSGDDCNDNDASKVADCSTPTVSTSPGGGGGGGGGGGVVGGVSPKASQVFAEIKGGETAIMKVNRSALAFTRVAFTAAASLSNVNVVVSPVNESVLAQGLPPSFLVYQYVDVSTGLSPDNISTASVDFKVPGSWLISNNLAADNVALFRYSGSSWEKFAPSITGSDSSYYYYAAALPGFSVFAVAAERPKPPEVAPPQPTANISALPEKDMPPSTANATTIFHPEEQPASIFSGKGARIAAFLAAVAVAAAFLWLVGKKNPKKGRK